MRIDYIRPDAVAYVSGKGSYLKAVGTVKFYQKRGGVLVAADVSGLPQENTSGFFGFHIHEGSSCGGEKFSETLNHYNPQNTEHPMHAGDLPPLLSAGGTAFMSFFTNRFTVREILGKTVVIHNSYDDFKTQPSGNAGEKIACGIINIL